MVSGLLFPENATEEERQIDWQLIAEISDKDFGFNNLKPKSDKTRFSVRCILQNSNGEICAIKSEKFGYIQIPGGGIDNEEAIVDALYREVQEETGFLIMNIKPIGYILERREDAQNKYDWGRAISYVFSASPEKEIGTNYTEYENAEGFRPIWMTLDDFIAEKEKSRNKVISYSGHFSDKRDLEIVKFYKNVI